MTPSIATRLTNLTWNELFLSSHIYFYLKKGRMTADNINKRDFGCVVGVSSLPPNTW